ncbi:RNA polymerase sigma factor sigma-70 region 4 domain-containing protein [Marinisporobacter balticus]|nr:hypothetical protein [Marinisporobacter balticus]
MPWVEMNDDLLSDENIPDIESTVFISMLLDALIPLQREVILRKFIYGFSDAEIAGRKDNRTGRKEWYMGKSTGAGLKTP